MPVTNQRQPLFLSSAAAADGQYVDVTSGFGTPTNVTLNRGIYCLTAVGVDITFAIGASGSLTGTNGAHLPSGDTRLIVIKANNTNFTCCLAPGGTTAGKLNIALVNPVREMF
jgi:hypothetical protein